MPTFPSVAVSFATAMGLFVLPAAAQRGEAVYDLTFASDWSAATHPIQFPGNPHFSPLVGGLHGTGAGFWQPGSLASAGIEEVAELGATAQFANEVNAAITAGTAGALLNYGGAGSLGTSPASVTVSFTATAEFPLLTLVSMLAPSPDWFVGVHGLPLIENGEWVDDLVVPLTVYDAGTDSGTSYTSGNANTSPPQPIATVTTASGPFQGAATVIGSFTLARRASTLVYGCGAAPAGIAVGGTATIGQTLTIRLSPPTPEWQPPALTGLAFATAPAAAFPCGPALAGFGLLAGSPGHVLLGSVDVLVSGPLWTGGDATLFVPLPNQAAFVGARFYVQGLVAANRVGLTDAISVVVGS